MPELPTTDKRKRKKMDEKRPACLSFSFWRSPRFHAVCAVASGSSSSLSPSCLYCSPLVAELRVPIHRQQQHCPALPFHLSAVFCQVIFRTLIFRLARFSFLFSAQRSHHAQRHPPSILLLHTFLKTNVEWDDPVQWIWDCQEGRAVDRVSPKRSGASSLNCELYQWFRALGLTCRSLIVSPITSLSLEPLTFCSQQGLR